MISLSYSPLFDVDFITMLIVDTARKTFGILAETSMAFIRLTVCFSSVKQATN